MNRKLEMMEADGTLENMVKQYLMPPPDAPCSGYKHKKRLGIGNVAGLWVLLASAVAIGLAWSILWKLYRRCMPPTNVLSKLVEKSVDLEHWMRSAISCSRPPTADATGGKEADTAVVRQQDALQELLQSLDRFREEVLNPAQYKL